MDMKHTSSSITKGIVDSQGRPTQPQSKEKPPPNNYYQQFRNNPTLLRHLFRSQTTARNIDMR